MACNLGADLCNEWAELIAEVVEESLRVCKSLGVVREDETLHCKVFGRVIDNGFGLVDKVEDCSPSGVMTELGLMRLFGSNSALQ